MVSALARERKVRVRATQATHRLMVAMDMARPRMRVGKISAITTQTAGPRPTAKQAANSRMRPRISAAGGGWIRKASASPTRETPMPAEENSSSGLRPTRSMIQSATMVNRKLIRPTITLAPMAADSLCRPPVP